MCHVLVIEDDYFLATQIADHLARVGVTSVALAGTQTEAVDAALEQRPMLILSDVRLIEGTGPGAVRAITAALGAIPVIFITGSPDECDPAIDAAAILTKPVAGQVLGRAIQSLVSVARADMPAAALDPAAASGIGRDAAEQTT